VLDQRPALPRNLAANEYGKDIVDTVARQMRETILKALFYSLAGWLPTAMEGDHSLRKWHRLLAQWFFNGPL